MAAILAVTILAVGGWLLWRIGRRLCIDSFGKRSRRARRRVRIESYHRFETLLAKRGFVAYSRQTQREFAAAAGD